jgi:hypothetical protein
MKIQNRLFCILLIILIVCLFLFLKLSEHNLNSTKSSLIAERELSVTNTLLEDNNLYLEWLTNGAFVGDSISLEDPYGNSLCFSDLPIGNGKILLYLEQTFCSDCYAAILEKLQKEYPLIVKKDLIIICSFMNFRELIIFFKVKGIDITPYNIIKGNLILPASSSNTPFLAFIDKRGYISNCCIIQKPLLKRIDIFIKAYQKIKGI